MPDGSYDEMALIDELASDLRLPHRRRPVQRVRWVGAEGQVVSGLRWGEDEPAMVLIHGGSLNAHSWDATLMLLDVPALALDMPGHGLSSWFPEPRYLPRAVAAALAPAIATLAPGCPVVVGHSLGGLAVLALARAEPELVPRLVVVDASPGSTPQRSRDILDFVAANDFASLEDAIDHAAGNRTHANRRSLRRAMLHNAHERDDGRWTWRHDARRLTDRDRWTELFEALPLGWEDAAALQCPVLLLVGGRSRIVPPEDVARYRSLVKDLRVLEIADAGHNIHSDQPRALGEAIVGFLHETGVALDAG